MKNTVAEIKKSNWVSSTVKWGKEITEESVKIGQMEITKSYKTEKQIK